MGKCFVTRLSGSTSNNELLRLGEMRIKLKKITSPSENTQTFSITAKKDTNLEIIGDGYFTGSNLSENKGKTMTIPADSTQSIIVSNNNLEIAILDKYSIASIGVNRNTAEQNMSVCIDDFKYSSLLTYVGFINTEVSGSIDSLKNCKGLTFVDLSKSSVYGDIASLKDINSLTNVSLAGTQISGDISNLKNLTSLNTLSLYNTKVSGDISNLKNLTSLKTLLLEGTNVYGDIGSLAGCTSLNMIKAYNSATPLTGDINAFQNISNLKEVSLKYSRLSGDLATLPASCKFVSFQNDSGSSFTWGTRASSSKIVAIEGNANLTNIDKMLQDQAQCQVGFASSDGVHYKTISVAGNRTSASDNAVATLQQKGYTVSIAKV